MYWSFIYASKYTFFKVTEKADLNVSPVCCEEMAIFLKLFADTCPFMGSTDTPEWAALFALGGGVRDIMAIFPFSIIVRKEI